MIGEQLSVCVACLASVLVLGTPAADAQHVYVQYNAHRRTSSGSLLGYLFDAINNTLVTPSGTLGWLASDEDGQLYARIQAQFGF